MPVRAGYDVAPLKRYINLTYHHALFKAGFDAHLKDENASLKGIALRDHYFAS